MPHQRARESRVTGATEAAAGPGGHVQLLDRPLLARIRIVVKLRRREAVEQRVIGRMRRDELALQVRGKLGHFDAIGGAYAH